MEPELRDLLTRLSLALGAPQSDENSDHLIEVFGDVEVKTDRGFKAIDRVA